jgi:fatty acid desaturase
MDAAPATFAELARLIRDRGLDRKAPGGILLELTLQVALAGLGCGLFLAGTGVALRAAGVLLGAIGLVGVGLNAHTSSHYATSDRRWVNELLVYFGYPFFVGISATYWWRSHVAIHHRHTAIIGRDDDLDLAPLFAVTDLEIESARGLRRLWYRRGQWLAFPLVLLVNGANMTLTGWRFVAAALRDPARRRTAHWIDAAALVLHWGAWVGLPLLWWPAGDVIAFYALRLMLAGYIMFAVFAPAHFPAEVRGLEAGGAVPDFVALQSAHTLNYRAGRLGSLYVAGLDHQIEHHLFPGLSHVRYGEVSPLVEAFCRRHGHPYRTLSWAAGIWKSWQVFREPKRVLRRTDHLAIARRGETRAGDEEAI